MLSSNIAGSRQPKHWGTSVKSLRHWSSNERNASKLKRMPIANEWSRPLLSFIGTKSRDLSRLMWRCTHWPCTLRTHWSQLFSFIGKAVISRNYSGKQWDRCSRDRCKSSKGRKSWRSGEKDWTTDWKYATRNSLQMNLTSLDCLGAVSMVC